MGDGDDSDATICISDDGGGVDGVFDVFQDNGSDEDELDWAGRGGGRRCRCLGKGQPIYVR